jgi:hypothetical protein
VGHGILDVGACHGLVRQLEGSLRCFDARHPSTITAECPRRPLRHRPWAAMAASSPAARSEYLGRYGEAGDSVAEEDRARAATMSVSAALSLGPTDGRPSA